QRLVVLQMQQRVDDRVVGLPVSRALADAAVDDEALRILGELHVVLEHAQERLLLPTPAAKLRTALGGDRLQHLVSDGRAHVPLLTGSMDCAGARDGRKGISPNTSAMTSPSSRPVSGTVAWQ